MTSHTTTHGKHGDFAIEAKGLVKRFKTGRSWVEVLKGVDFDARHGDLRDNGTGDRHGGRW